MAVAKKRGSKKSEPLNVLELFMSAASDEAQTAPLRGHAGLTLRDEANAITAQVLRSQFLEELHRGTWSPILSDPSFSRLTDEEMKKLMIETSAQLAGWMHMRERLLTEQPEAYFQLLEAMQLFHGTDAWERRAVTYEVPATRKAPVALCLSCKVALHEGWRFCPMCGAAAPGGVTAS